VTLPDGEPIPFMGWVKEDTSQVWQYLTDNEIKEIIGGYGNEGGIGAYTRSLIDKIEAKIREKNERKPKENN
jgi:hypothetical protein